MAVLTVRDETMTGKATGSSTISDLPDRISVEELIRWRVREGFVVLVGDRQVDEIDDRSLIVRGDCGTYRIHLDSGNVMMDPGRYLCIVCARGGPKTGTVLLPFEDDALLGVILSQAFLLAADPKITDPTILQQMGS
jgi:hypothetical protein